MNQDTRLPLFKTIWRLLTFRITAEELHRLDLRFFLVGLVGTWLVGMGRYWDSPDASYGQRAGLGSVFYVFVLAMMLYLVGIPLMLRNWSYRSVLTFVTLTSFPAALYAIPVERWAGVQTAITLNVLFLSVVAIYRVALYLMFMQRSAGLSSFPALVAAILPITLIISFITLSGYSGIVFDIMAGLRQREPHAQDGVNEILLGITTFSCLSLPFWAIIYGALIVHRRRSQAETV